MVGLALALLVACEAPAPTRPLPDALSAVLRLDDGAYVSLLVDLRGDDGAPTVRATSGVLAVGEDAVLTLTETSRSPGERAAHLTELLTGRELSLPYERAIELLKIDPEGSAVVRVDDHIQTLSLLDGTVRPGGSQQAQGAYAPGPGEGFHLRVREGRLELLRPQGSDRQWIPLAEGVAQIEGASWLRMASVAPEGRALVESRLKEVDAVPVEVGSAEADGDLSEWRGAAARRVERAAQVLSGLEGWRGPRDASFGVSARRVGDAVVLAVRVRDDAWEQGDALEVVWGARSIYLPLGEAAGVRSGPGWQAEQGEAGWQGLPVELSLSAPRADGLDALPMVVQLVDVDPGEAPTRLGSAPDALLASLAAEGVERLQ